METMNTGKNRTGRKANTYAVDEMVQLLRAHYKVCIYPQRDGGMYVMMADGRDGGDILPDGTYVYDTDKSVDLWDMEPEEVIAVLNEYFGI